MFLSICNGTNPSMREVPRTI